MSGIQSPLSWDFMDFRFIISGLFLLACGSFIDNSRGVLLPVIVEKFHLDYLQSGSFFIAGNIGAVVATFLLIPLTQKISEKRLALVFAAIGIVGLGLGRWVSDYVQLVLFAIFLGSILSLYGALSNLFVIRGTEPRTRSKMMCGLHMVYGLTSIVAPLVSSFFLLKGVSWAGCLFSISILLFGMAGFIGFKIPDESPVQVHTNLPNGDGVNSHPNGDGARLSLNRLKKWVVLTFCLYMAGEVMTSMWLVTYLIQVKGLSISLSSQYQSGFFAIMTVVRGLCFLSFSQEQEDKLIVLCVLLGLGFFALGFFGGYLWAFPAVGLLGPFFPVFLGRVSRVFHRQAKSLVLWILSMGQFTLALCHFGVGKIAGLVGVQTAYGLAGIMLALTLAVFGVYLSKERRYLGGLH